MSEPVHAAGAICVDDAGVSLPAGFEGSVDVHFDDHHAWSFSARAEGPDAPVHVAWPKRMRGWLDGASRVRLVQDDVELWVGEVALGSGEGRIDFLDQQGVPVMIDKWGLLQRPFSGRDRRAIEQMVDVAEQILDIMSSECGIDAWIAFGTLLGAAREGTVIGHDSDIDLAYLSHRDTPAEMVQELHGVSRALRDAGMQVVEKSGSFVTVVFRAPDGAQGSIDVYTCFHLGELLYETATVRSPVPVEAIEPLTRLDFEGRALPAPADPARLLVASYGPSWRVPDPSFAHRPDQETRQRFDQWFGSLMRQRRDWESALAAGAQAEAPDGTWAGGATDDSFVGWVCAGTRPEQRIVEVGCGTGHDALAVARTGRAVLALDYARSATDSAARSAQDEELQFTFKSFNLYSLRDVMTRAAMVSRDGHAGPGRVVVARELLEALEPDGVQAFWLFCSMVCRGGGRLMLEGVSASRRDLAARRADVGGGRVRCLDPADVEEQAVRAGARVRQRERFEEAAEAVRGQAGPVRWRMSVEWSESDTGGTGNG